MCVRDAFECEKGDISRQGLAYEIVVERSSPNSEQTTCTMWKRVRGLENNFKREFGVWRCYAGARKMKWEQISKWTDNEAEARRVYEQCCRESECSPYPEAEDYFKRNGRLKD